MSYFKAAMSDEERDEAERLNRKERAEREPEETEDTPLVRYCRTQPEMAASQISSLQDAAGYWASLMHQTDNALVNHNLQFNYCGHPDCRKLRDRLRPL